MEKSLKLNSKTATLWMRSGVPIGREKPDNVIGQRHARMRALAVGVCA